MSIESVTIAVNEVVGATRRVVYHAVDHENITYVWGPQWCEVSFEPSDYLDAVATAVENYLEQREIDSLLGEE